MADSAVHRLLTLRLDGTDEHRGHVMAHALQAKLDQFLKTFGSFERAYLNERTRQTDFEVVELKHNSPTTLGLNPVSRSRKYLPGAAVNWTLKQWDKIARGERPDDVVDEGLVAEVAELAQRQDKFAYGAFSVRYETKAINLDEAAYANAQKLRLAMKAAMPAPPWRGALSQGTVTGTLESVLNANSERQIVICPFVGPRQITCNFTEEFKDQMGAALFKVVRITGLMHYSDTGPHPVLVDVQRLELITPDVDAPHFIDAEGLFKNSIYPPRATNDL